MEVTELSLVKDQLNSQPLVLRPGQLLKGRVLKVDEGNIAAIQIGSARVYAQTSVNLDTNREFWFVVEKNGEGLTLTIMNENQFLKGASPQMILQKLGMDSSQQNIELVRWFQAREMPLDQSLLKSFSQWMTGNIKQDMAVFKVLLDRRLPLTNDVFNAVHSIKHDVPVDVVIKNLQRELGPFLHQQTANTLDKQLTRINHTYSDRILRGLLVEWLKGGTAAQESFAILQKLGVLQAKAPEEKLVQQLLYTSINEENGKNKEILTLMQNMVNKGLQTATAPFLLALTKLNHAFAFKWDRGAHLQAAIKNGEMTVPLSAQHMTRLIKDGLARLFGQSAPAFMKTALPIEEVYTRLHEQLRVIQPPLATNGTNPSHQVLQAIAEEVRQQIHTPAVIKGELKQLLARFGLSYEYQISERQQVDTQALKPLVLQLLKEHKQPALVEAAKDFLSKMTGMQLLSNDSNGLSHFVVQFPISLSAFSKVLSMQWSSKSKKNGEIDPEFCHVLFHLNMETLGETLIKLQIQNRVISMNIAIENKESLSDIRPFEELMKKNLSETNFHLAQISISKIASKATKIETEKTEMTQSIGVDIRI